MKYYLKNLITGKTMFRFPNKEILENWIISLSSFERYGYVYGAFWGKTKESKTSIGNLFLEGLCTNSVEEYKKNKRILDKILSNDSQINITLGEIVISKNILYDDILFNMFYNSYMRGYALRKSCIIINDNREIYDFSKILYKSIHGEYTKEYIKNITESCYDYARHSRFCLMQHRQKRYKVGNYSGAYERIHIKKYIPFDVSQDDCDYQSNNCLKIKYHRIRFRNDEHWKGAKPNWKDIKRRKSWMRKGDIFKQNKFKQDLWNCYYDVEYSNLNLED